jgi:hypothetical protein
VTKLSLKGGGCAQLHGKAWDSRIVTGWLAQELSTAARSDAHQQDRLIVVNSFARLYTLLEQADQYLSYDEAKMLFDLGMQGLFAYKRIHDQTDGPHWALRPKFHSVEHSLHDMLNFRLGLIVLGSKWNAVFPDRSSGARGLNIRFWGGYQEEDLCGRVRNIANSTHPSRMSNSTMERYILKLD